MNPNRGLAREQREKRLEQIRNEAQTAHQLRIVESDESLAQRTSAENGYYGMPVLKAPQWSAEVPIYFFVGGAAGAAALIGTLGHLSSGDRRMVREARWIAAMGGAISPALLIADLGMPTRFLNMLRVFKVQSPMSVGSWTLVLFSSAAAATALFDLVAHKHPRQPLSVLADVTQIVSALSGLVLATYTGVLVGATCIPAWNEHVSLLPIHFAASGLGAAASMLELRGHSSRALDRIAIGAAIAETAMGMRIELSRKQSSEPLRSGFSGWAMRGAGLLSGPIPLALRVLALGSRRKEKRIRKAAAISTIAGSLLTRWAWVQAGRVSAEDPKVQLQAESVVPGKKTKTGDYHGQ